MLRFPCLVLDHDDTVVQSEATVNYPFFCYILDKLRPGTKITLKEYNDRCFNPGFTEMCQQIYGFDDEEMEEEYQGWKAYIMEHIPLPYPGIKEVITRQKAEGGYLCVVSHSCEANITRDYQTHFGILPDDIYGWDLPEEQRKPNPYALNQIMAKYHLRPEDILVVDDLKSAQEMAAKVGCSSAFAAWGKLDYPEIVSQMEKICDYSFHSAEDFYNFLFADV